MRSSDKLTRKPLCSKNRVCVVSALSRLILFQTVDRFSAFGSPRSLICHLKCEMDREMFKDCSTPDVARKSHGGETAARPMVADGQDEMASAESIARNRDCRTPPSTMRANRAESTRERDPHLICARYRGADIPTGSQIMIVKQAARGCTTGHLTQWCVPQVLNRSAQLHLVKARSRKSAADIYNV